MSLTISVFLLIAVTLSPARAFVDFKPPGGDDVPSPPDFSKIKSEDVAAQFGWPKKVIDPKGVDLMSLNKVCTPQWRDNNSYYEDARCMKWPEVCDYMPSPAPVPFAVFTEMFPCFFLTKEIILHVAQLQHAALTSIEKCMWDYILMFLNACYPGLDPRVLVNMIQSGKLVNDMNIGIKMNMDQAPITAPPLFG